MIFGGFDPRLAERLSRHDIARPALPGRPDGDLWLGNGRLRAGLFGGPDLFGLAVSLDELPLGGVVLRAQHPPPDTDPRPLPTGGAPGVHLRLLDATARVNLSPGLAAEGFVAAERAMVVLRVRSPRGARAALALTSQGGLPSPGVGCHARADGPYRYLLRSLPDRQAGALCGFVYGARSHARLEAEAVTAEFDIPLAGECILLVGIASTDGRSDPAPAARFEVERALPHGYFLLHREHAVNWERFWTGAEPDLPDGTEDPYRQAYRARVTGSRAPALPGGQAP